jgi:cysteine synthase A
MPERAPGLRLDDLVMRTPVLPLVQDSGAIVWVKLEFLQPSGSTKDRFAATALCDALDRGLVAEGGLVIEASSGSTSIALAMMCARLGLRFVAVLPETVSVERVMIIRRLGGEVVPTPAVEGMTGALDRACRLAEQDPSAFLPRQFSNPLNVQAHEMGTGRELLEQVAGPIHAFVAGVGTGGTLAGVGRALRATWPEVALVEARPADGDSLCPSPGIPGIVAGASALLDDTPIAGVIDVCHAEVLDATRTLCRMGLPVGLSSGLNVAAARRLAARLPAGTQVTTVLPDRMERYFSGSLFADLAPGPQCAMACEEVDIAH